MTDRPAISQRASQSRAGRTRRKARRTAPEAHATLDSRLTPAQRIDHRRLMSPADPTSSTSTVHGDATLLHAALERLERLDPGDERWEAELSPLSMGVVDALLAADT